MKRCLMLLIIVIFVFVGCGINKDVSLQSVLDSGQIRIATSPDYPPFEFIDSRKSGKEQYVGADIKLMKFIANELKVKLVIQATNFDTVLALTYDKTVDLAISGFTYSIDREENYLYSDYYFDEGEQGILVLKSKYTVETTFDEFIDKLIGAQSSTLQSYFVTEQIGKNSLKKFERLADGIMLLDNNNIDGIALSERVAMMIINQYSNKYVFLNQRFIVNTEETRTYVILPKESNALANKINVIIEKVIDERLYYKWDDEAKALAYELGVMG